MRHDLVGDGKTSPKDMLAGQRVSLTDSASPLMTNISLLLYDCVNLSRLLFYMTRDNKHNLETSRLFAMLWSGKAKSISQRKTMQYKMSIGLFFFSSYESMSQRDKF